MAKVSFSYNSETNQVAVAIDSPSSVSAAQVKFDVPDEVTIGDVKTSGFMERATHISRGREHRWYNLAADGSSRASVIITISIPKADNDVITLFGVDLRDMEGKEVEIESEFPLWVQLGSIETESTKLPEKSMTEQDGQSHISFVSNRDTPLGIYVMYLDGSNQKRLADIPNWHWASQSRWSPDGRKMVTESYIDGKWQVGLIDANTGKRTGLVTETDINDFGGPDWSPDGKKIAFSCLADGKPAIYVANADGGGPTRVTHNQEDDWGPAWSPDGSKIAFTSYRDSSEDIYIMNLDGGAETRLTNSPGYQRNPVWSPDGVEIAYLGCHGGSTWEIYIMNSDGSNQKRLTYATTEKPSSSKSWSPWYIPQFSPDGKKLVFASSYDGKWQIYVINVDGTNLTRLSNDSSNNSSPAWSPDGRKIAFTSDRDGNNEIYVMDSDGTNQRRLTYNDEEDSHPLWVPRGGQ